MGRHAYLFLVYEGNFVLESSLKLLDCPENDIYIHIDKKTSDNEKNKINRLISKLSYSNAFVYSRYKVFWGTNSITKAELYLLKKASYEKRGYNYYHILSGADLPIKSNEHIHKLFDEHGNKEYIHFGTAQYQKDIKSRYSQYHFLCANWAESGIINSGLKWKHIHLQYKED